jgi:hypothetical protein
VLVARPVIFDLSEIARRVVEKPGDLNIQEIAALLQQSNDQMQKEAGTKIGSVMAPLFETASKIRLPFSVQMMEIVEQITSLDWKSSYLAAPTLEGFLAQLSQLAEKSE